MKRLLGGVVLAAAVALGVRTYRKKRRAIATVPVELRHPILYLPFPLTSRTLARAARRLPVRPTQVAPGVTADHRQDPVPMFVYQPAARSVPSGALLYMHGGGFVAGHPATYHHWCSRMAADLGIPVISVDYRKAVDHPFPAALDDCFAALRWIHESAAALGVDPSRVAVAGDSAGGGLAATLAQMAHDRGVPVRFQALIYPMLDDRTALRTDHLGTGELVLTPSSNRFSWTTYLGHKPQEQEHRPYAAAARRENLSGLPPAWIGVGDLDLLHQENVAYAGSLSRAGVPCELVVIPGMYHGADAFLDGRSPTMTAFRTDMIEALRKAVTTHR